MLHWMSKFIVYIKMAYPSALETNGQADKLRTAVIENLEIFIKRKANGFQDSFKGLVSDVFHLLVTPARATSPFRDRVTIAAIRFMAKVSTSVNHSLLSSSEVLPNICQKIVFPNVKLRDEDEELFTKNEDEYIKQEIEGSDVDTRRSVACKLLRSLAVNDKKNVTDLVKFEMDNILNSANPGEQWKEKVSAINLAMSLDIKDSSHVLLVDAFFHNFIAPELQWEEINASPMVKAGALKFFTAFREQIPKEASLALLPCVIDLLSAESQVVCAFAANCVEKLLLVKDQIAAPASVLMNAAVHSHARFGPSDLDPLALQLLTNILTAPWQSFESEAGQYAMKCAMRVIGATTVVGSPQVSMLCILQLSLFLREVVSKKPVYPASNHYLFEAIAVLISKFSEDKNPSLIDLFEDCIFESINRVLTTRISELLFPYPLQIFAQIVEVRKAPLSERQLNLFLRIILCRIGWGCSNGGPALVLLLGACLRKMTPADFENEGRMFLLVEVFYELITSPGKEHLGFSVISAFVENIDFGFLEPFMVRIWNVLLAQLQKQSMVKKFVDSLIIFMSLVLVKRGPGVLVDSIKPKLLARFLQQYWVPYLKHISGSAVEVKLVSIASTRLLCESPILLIQFSPLNLWGKMLDGVMTLVMRAQPEELGEKAGENVLPGQCPLLQYAGKKEADHLKEIEDPKEYLVSSLARLSSLSPGRHNGIIDNKCFRQQNRNALTRLCGAYNSTIG